jgi:hypothetical protein
MLDRGVETGQAFKQLIADFLGVPTGANLRRMRRAFDHLENPPPRTESDDEEALERRRFMLRRFGDDAPGWFMGPRHRRLGLGGGNDNDDDMFADPGAVIRIGFGPPPGARANNNNNDNDNNARGNNNAQPDNNDNNAQPNNNAARANNDPPAPGNNGVINQQPPNRPHNPAHPIGRRRARMAGLAWRLGNPRDNNNDDDDDMMDPFFPRFVGDWEDLLI